MPLPIYNQQELSLEIGRKNVIWEKQLELEEQLIIMVKLIPQQLQVVSKPHNHASLQLGYSNQPLLFLPTKQAKDVWERNLTTSLKLSTANMAKVWTKLLSFIL